MASILFFTDGISSSNMYDQRGDYGRLKDLKEQLNFKYPINVYGFGQYTRLNSRGLLDIAILFGGLFGYIPDPTNLGTTFVNAIANILTTAATNVQL